jgi:hypothetical protein
VYRLLRGHYSSFIAPTDSCVNPVWRSPTSAFGLVREVFAGCYQPLLLPGFSRRYFCESFLRCPSPYPGGLLSAFAWFFPSIHRPSPSFDWVSFPLPSVNTTFHGSAFEAAAISLCSGLRACLPPRSFLPLQVPLQGRRGFYVRAERASLPSHASDMLSARPQAIGGTRTFISQDSQPCRLLPNDAAVSTAPPIIRTAGFPRYGWKVGISGSAFPHVTRVKPAPGMPCATLGLRLPFVHSAAPLDVPLGVGTVDSVAHCHSRSRLLYPRGPRSGLGYIVPAHQRLIDLIRPTRRRIPISPHGGLYGMPSLCWCA